ncbi:MULTISPECIES: D-alanine--D-alanine ligase [unclassified Streptomyces]|uniref:D-alanine--D-alanine ligase family protein n=1 Tax=unclassified Streptomyces TaxID=2593676 RepID=UPI00037045D1|nr:D-alanine--D-alanine ligase [Streptomyces sp. BoleA5]MYX36922.1 D-alanine--D-alanine ligase [Streptomyces sp. SID8377]
MTAPRNAARIRVAVIGGGRSAEHEVSLASAASVRSALDPAAHDVVGLTIGRDGVWRDAAGQPLAGSSAASMSAALGVLAGCDVVFPVMHGPMGEDGTLAALLDLADLPYVGAGVRAGALAMDKWATKLVAEAVGIAVAPGYLVTAESADQARFDRPVVVKPVAAGSSHGVSLVTEEAELAPAIAAALRIDDRVLVEDLVTGREVDLAVLQRADGRLVVGPPLEILLDDGRLFDTEQKYDGGARFLIPAPLSAEEHDRLAEASLALFTALGCRGVARCDFFLTPDGPVLNEVNTMPGMTAQSQVPKMFAHRGLTYPALLGELVRGALAAAGTAAAATPGQVGR